MCVWCFVHIVPGLGWAASTEVEGTRGPFSLRTSDKEVRSGIFNFVWVYNKVCGLAAEAQCQ